MIVESEIINFRRNLRKIERAVTNRLKNEGKCCGVTFNECGILLELADSEKISVNDLADRLSIDKSIISKTVDSLYTAGFILREEDKTDRRKKTLSLSPEGIKKIDFINSIMNDLYLKRFALLEKEEYQVFIQSVEQIAEIFDKWDTLFSVGNCWEDNNECNCN